MKRNIKKLLFLQNYGLLIEWLIVVCVCVQVIMINEMVKSFKNRISLSRGLLNDIKLSYRDDIFLFLWLFGFSSFPRHTKHRLVNWSRKLTFEKKNRFARQTSPCIAKAISILESGSLSIMFVFTMVSFHKNGMHLYL